MWSELVARRFTPWSHRPGEQSQPSTRTRIPETWSSHDDIHLPAGQLTEGVSRRALLTRSAAGLGLALSGAVPGVFGTARAHGGGRGAGYGPLVSDPAGVLALPEGFEYTIVAQAGVTLLDSGQPSPSDNDGMASFVRRGGSGSVLVNNHEISGSEPFEVPHLPRLVYDESAGGGTTTIEVDGHGRLVRQRVSLAGTHNNCAGGRTPWETWLTCEETEAILGRRHGYVFEVDPYDQRANLSCCPVPCSLVPRR